MVKKLKYLNHMLERFEGLSPYTYYPQFFIDESARLYTKNFVKNSMLLSG